jgi:hypothetical protein
MNNQERRRPSRLFLSQRLIIMKKIYLPFVLLCLLFSLQLDAQNMSINVAQVTHDPIADGPLVQVDITVENYVNVVSYQGTINFDPDFLDFASNITSNDPFFQAFAPNDSQINFIWTDFLVSGSNKANGDVLMSVFFDLVPATPIGTITPVTIDGSGTALLYGVVSNAGTPQATITQYTPTINQGAVAIGTNFPVEMLSFDAKAEDNGQALLEWSTASETNNQYFEVQWSDNASDFSPIGQVGGAGTTQEQQNYSFRTPMTSLTNYYRLKQVDFDGQFTYSKVVELQLNAETSAYQLVPNPAQGVVNILPGESFDPEQEYQVNVFGIQGNVLYQKRLGQLQINSPYPIDLSDLAAGLYFVELKSKRGQTSRLPLVLK